MWIKESSGKKDKETYKEGDKKHKWQKMTSQKAWGESQKISTKKGKLIRCCNKGR